MTDKTKSVREILETAYGNEVIDCGDYQYPLNEEVLTAICDRLCREIKKEGKEAHPVFVAALDLAIEVVKKECGNG